MSDEEDECPVCDGARVTAVRVCKPECALRHAPGCPVLRLVPCPMCEKRELGEDLNA